MTETTGSTHDASATSAPIPPTPPTAPTAPIAPTAPPANFAASGSPSWGSAPTPPPLAPQHQPESQRRRRPVRTVAGVLIAVLFIGIKIAIAVGAGHLLTGSSGPVVIGIILLLVLFGFLSRFMRL